MRFLYFLSPFRLTGTGTVVVNKSTSQQQQHISSPVSTMTLTGQVTSNQSSITSNVITVSKQMAQGVVSGNSPQTILPANVQILNVNALRPQNSQGGVNKNMSRVMIPQVVGGRPGGQAVSSNISLSNTPGFSLNLFRNATVCVID